MSAGGSEEEGHRLPAMAGSAPDCALAGMVDRLLARGAVVRGELWLSVAGVDLVFVGVDLVLASGDLMRGSRDG